MEVDIPIIVTRSTAQHYPPTFKPAPSTLCNAIKSKRALSVPSGKHLHLNPSPRQHPNAHLPPQQPSTLVPSHPLRTVEPNRPPSIDQMRHQTMEQSSRRSRRISSSAAAKRFPKDFFKEDATPLPKTTKTKHKQYQPNTLLDTFNQKQFATVEPTATQDEPDTPTFKDKESKWSSLPTDPLQPLQGEKMPLKQRKGQELIDTVEPFGPIPLISNFNLTLGQKEMLGNLITKKQQIKSRRHEKENNHQTKGDIFRIRKKMPN